MLNGRPGIYISYRRDDTKWFAALLRERVSRAMPSCSVFLDIANIEPGLDFSEALYLALDQCAVQFVLIGQRWLTEQDQSGRRRLDLEHDWVRMEVERALANKLRVIPILVDSAMMPKAEDLPPSISLLSSRQTIEVSFEENETSIATILTFLSQLLSQPLTPTLDGAASVGTITTGSANAVMNFFEPEANDAETLSVLGEHQLDCGRFGLAKEIFSLVRDRDFRQYGYEEVGVFRAIYRIDKASLLLGEFSDAVQSLTSILWHIERLRDESYPLYVRVQIAIARGCLELRDSTAARQVLPKYRGMLFADQSLTATNAWIEHLEGNDPRRDLLLKQLEAEIAQHPPTIEFFRSLSKLRQTMLNGEPPTMRWNPHEFDKRSPD